MNLKQNNMRNKSKETLEIIELNKLGYSNFQIAKLLNINNKTRILSVIYRNNLKSNAYHKIENDYILRQLILGSILGDGYLVKISGLTKESKLSLGHSLKQKDYLEYKVSILKEYDLDGVIYESTVISDRYIDNKYTSVFSKSRSHTLFTYYRNLFYKDNIKILNEEIYKIDAFGLAIWFMDDGQKRGISGGIQMNSQGFSVNDCNILRDVLETKFKIKTTLQKGNIIYIMKQSVDLFLDIIKPYIINSMIYKTLGPV
jgi:hypothetical protein